jgi:hypothetical protein
LAHPPIEISFQQVFELFEREDRTHLCPFGGGICGVGTPCALHDRLVNAQNGIKSFLADSTFEIFRYATQVEDLKPTDLNMVPTKPRESFRALGKKKS